MQIEELMSNYSGIGDMISLVCCVTLLFLFHWVLFFSKDRKFEYLKISVHFIMLGSATNIIFSIACSKWGQYTVLIYMLRLFYHFCFMCCLYLFLLYIKRMQSVDSKLIRNVSYLTRILFIIALVFEILSPFTKFGFHREGDLWYDPLISAYNAFYIYAIVLLLVMLLIYSRRVIKSVRFCLITTEFIVMFLMGYGAVKNNNTFTSFTYVLPIFVVMILLHSKPFDDKTGALGEDSFDSYINLATKRGESFDYMIMKLDSNVISKLPDELGKIMNNFWFDYFKGAKLFNVQHNLYVLVIPRTAKNGDTETKIRKLLNEDFLKYYERYQLKYKLIGLLDMDFIQNDVDIKSIINYLLITMDDNTMKISDDELKEKMKLLRVVRENLYDIELKDDMEDERVLAFCQPIKNMITGKYDTGEALMRLSLPELGVVPPNLFIPLAEYYGYIHTLTRIMLNKVCKQVKQLEEEGYQFNRISVNFTASEMRMNNFCHEVLNIIEKYGINPSRIGIELTESQNESDFKIVSDKMNKLKSEGMTFYLDDVGTGYSNLDRIVKYDVDIVKFDRFFLLEAEKDDKVVQLMKHLSEAFKGLNYKLLFEGVETEENEALCMECGAEYIQGFKYSKPLPIEEMRNFFEK